MYALGITEDEFKIKLIKNDFDQFKTNDPEENEKALTGIKIPQIFKNYSLENLVLLHHHITLIY